MHLRSTFLITARKGELWFSKIIERSGENQDLIIGVDLQFCTRDGSQKDGMTVFRI